MTWRQVGGDMRASSDGVIFLDAEPDHSLATIVEIFLWSKWVDDTSTDYFAFEQTYGPEDVAPHNARLIQALQVTDTPPDSSFEELCHALFDCWGGEPVNEAQWPTLKEAMDHWNIPAEALWDPREYEAPNPDEPDDEEDTEQEED